MDELAEREGGAAAILGRQFGDIGVDRNELDADAEAGDEAADVETERGRTGRP